MRCAIAALAVAGLSIGAAAKGAEPGRDAADGTAVAVVAASLPRETDFDARGPDGFRLVLRPNVRLGVAPAVAMKLRAGFDLALDRVERESACRALFADLGGEAREALGGTLYYGSTPAQEDGRCRYAYAVTQIGSAVTWVCQRNFVEVGLEHAARILIHEALHRAGLPERPQAPDAKSAREIDRMIHTRCGL
jgi:hypothetical protein